MSQLFSHLFLTHVATTLFQSAGASEEEANVTAESLVQSSLMGHDSHGVMRIPEYLEFIDNQSLLPGAPVEVEMTGPATAIVDCGYNFGAVGGTQAMTVAVKLARQQRTACVITRRCNHVGRLGAYVQMAADEAMIALATCNSPIYGHFVLPWGGREGRLATNPIAYAVPTGGDPIVADFSTSVAPEGKIRFYRNQGKSLPDGWILDAAGNPTTDPDKFYGPPRGGILPLGASVGYKGFALSLLVEILGSALAGISSTDTEVFGNGVCFIVIDPSAFCPIDQFRQLMDETVAYLKSSRPAPGVDEILLPGELEFRTMRKRLEQGVPVDDPSWQAIEQHATKRNIDLDAV